MTIRDLNRAMDWSLPDDEANTVAGLVINEAQIIPDQGQVFLFHGFRFEVEERKLNRLTKLRVRPVAEAQVAEHLGTEHLGAKQPGTEQLATVSTVTVFSGTAPSGTVPSATTHSDTTPSDTRHSDSLAPAPQQPATLQPTQIPQPPHPRADLAPHEGPSGTAAAPLAAPPQPLLQDRADPAAVQASLAAGQASAPALQTAVTPSAQPPVSQEPLLQGEPSSPASGTAEASGTAPASGTQPGAPAGLSAPIPPRT